MAVVVRRRVSGVMVFAPLVILSVGTAGRTEPPAASTSGRSRPDAPSGSPRTAAAYGTWKRIKDRHGAVREVDFAEILAKFQ